MKNLRIQRPLTRPATPTVDDCKRALQIDPTETHFDALITANLDAAWAMIGKRCALPVVDGDYVAETTGYDVVRWALRPLPDSFRFEAWETRAWREVTQGVNAELSTIEYDGSYPAVRRIVGTYAGVSVPANVSAAVTRMVVYLYSNAGDVASDQAFRLSGARELLADVSAAGDPGDVLIANAL